MIMTSKQKTLYDGEFFDRMVEGALKSAQAVVPVVLEFARAESVVDVGCGLGAWLRAFRENGVGCVVGLDGPYVDQSKLLIDPGEFRQVDLRRPISLDRTFDLAVCLEVAEHLPARASRPLVKSLTASAPIVLFSAAIPGQGGTRHINEQWPNYWKSLFAEYGFSRLDAIRPRIWRDDRVEWWYRQNISLFASAGAIASSPRLREEERLAQESQLELIYGPLLAPYTFLTGLLRQIPRAAVRAVRQRFP